MPSTPRFIISSKNWRMRSGEAPSKSVVLVVTRKPRRRAVLIPCTASSNTPSRHTASSWSSRSPSMCTLKVRYGEGVKRSSFSSRRMALVQRYTYFFRLTSSTTSLSMSGYMRGSPPGMLTMGAPHSSTALRHCSTVRCFLRMSGVLDLAATRAGEITAEERLEHQDEGVASAARELLLDDVARHREHLGQRHTHLLRIPLCRSASWATEQPHRAGALPSRLGST